jgi:hypothetical protein
MRFAWLVLAAAVAFPLHAGSELAPTRIYAQELVNQTLARHPDLLVLAMHVTPPGASENVIIASNIGRIGKRADAEDQRIRTRRGNWSQFRAARTGSVDGRNCRGALVRGNR